MTPPTTTGEIVFVTRQATKGYAEPLAIITAHTLDQVRPCLERVEKAVGEGLHAAGFIAYEAAPAFDPALVTCPPHSDLPLVWFGIYAKEQEQVRDEKDAPPPRLGPWIPRVSRDEYEASLARLREWIASGDTYQVNFTFPMETTFEGSSRAWFQELCAAQRSAYSAYLDLGSHVILSLSPELFFELNGDKLTARPMKGTRPRGRWTDEDRHLAQDLQRSEKDRAENVMIVDLLRNDMGRVSATGSVRVERLFELERYETVWQMTSTITSRTTASVPAIVAALFPCGSVTGAPKARTMAIIRDEEHTPRGVYCGTICRWRPGRKATFSVAIRTVTLDRATGKATCHVGSGVTWESVPRDEYAECLQKAAFLTSKRPRFELLESLLLEDDFFLLDEHLSRLEASADYFGFRVDTTKLRQALLTYRRSLTPRQLPMKVRVLLAPNGAWRLEGAPAPPVRPVRLAVASAPVSDRDVFLFHKTTNRRVYERATSACSGFDDVLLWNERGEFTESTTANLVVLMKGHWLTPPVECGLLPGTFRTHLLATGILREAVLHKADIKSAEKVCLINSVRRWIPVKNIHWPS